MAGKFNLNDLLNQGTTKVKAEKDKNTDVAGGYEIKNIDVDNLIPSEENFYSMNNIEELKNSIELTGKVVQPLIVTPLGTQNRIYKILSGHRRRQAILSLVAEGKNEYKKVPCIVEDIDGDYNTKIIKEELILISANSQREKTAWDKVEEAKRTRTLLESMKNMGSLAGDLRKNIAKVLQTSSTQVARYDAINRNLIDEFIEVLKANQLNISVAYEISGLSKEEQNILYQDYSNGKEIELSTVQEIKRNSRENREKKETTNIENKEIAEDKEKIIARESRETEDKKEIAEAITTDDRQEESDTGAASHTKGTIEIDAINYAIMYLMSAKINEPTEEVKVINKNIEGLKAAIDIIKNL